MWRNPGAGARFGIRIPERSRSGSQIPQFIYPRHEAENGGSCDAGIGRPSKKGRHVRARACAEGGLGCNPVCIWPGQTGRSADSLRRRGGSGMQVEARGGPHIVPAPVSTICEGGRRPPPGHESECPPGRRPPLLPDDAPRQERRQLCSSNLIRRGTQHNGITTSCGRLRRLARTSMWGRRPLAPCPNSPWGTCDGRRPPFRSCAGCGVRRRARRTCRSNARKTLSRPVGTSRPWPTRVAWGE